MSTPAVIYDKTNPFLARIIERHRLTTEKSQKETIHLTIDIAGSGLSYQSGDSLGIYPQNNPETVDALIETLGFSRNEIVQLPREGKSMTVYDALLSQFSLGSITKKFVQLVHDRATSALEKEKLELVLNNPDPAEQKAWLDAREFIDIAEEFPSAKFQPQEYIEQLRKLVPRLYSISSSPAKYPTAIELTIAVVRHQSNGRHREGTCSTYLAERVALNKPEVPVFVASSHFGPPEDDNAPIIMVGPGTGIAPFRSFLQDRAAHGAKGKNWLFFGDQHKETDFLYADELQAYLASGLLTKLSTAFSRDQEYKIYVQDRMREHGAEIWKWLEEGAYFYVCGDAKRMAKDVDAMLHEIIATHGKLWPDAASEYIKQLKQSKRYQRDVY